MLTFKTPSQIKSDAPFSQGIKTRKKGTPPCFVASVASEENQSQEDPQHLMTFSGLDFQVGAGPAERQIFSWGLDPSKKCTICRQ